MSKLTSESSAKLQKILKKRIGRDLTNEELEQAYDALMGFAVALVELEDSEPESQSPTKKKASSTKSSIANTQENSLQYV